MRLYNDKNVIVIVFLIVLLYIVYKKIPVVPPTSYLALIYYIDFILYSESY